MVPFGCRYGRTFSETVRLLQDTTYMEPERLAGIQWSMMQGLLAHAYENVPHYRKAFDERGMHPKDFRSAEHWKACDFPVLTRAALTENRQELIAKNFRFEREDRQTWLRSSGSTGEPVQVRAYKDIYESEAAFVERAIKANDATLYFGRSAWWRRYCPDVERGDPLWYWDAEQQRLYLSAFHVTRSNAQAFVDAVNRSRAPLLVTYPSMAYVLACLFEENRKLRFEHVRHIQVSSESLRPEWERKIEEVLRVPVRDHYGQQEKACFHFRCAGGHAYHEAVEYGFTEVRAGRVLATGFLNRLMPLIRYDTGDLAVTGPEPKHACSACGSTLPRRILEFHGRSDDFIEGAQGQFVPSVNLYTMFYSIPGVRMFQVIQEGKNDLTVTVVPGQGYSYATERAVRREIAKRVGPMDVFYDLAEEIERDLKSGKVRCVLRRRPRED